MYYQDWHRTRRPKLAVEGGILPAVSQAVAPSPHPSDPNASISTGYGSPRNTLSSNTGIVVAVNDGSSNPASPLLQTPPPPPTTSTGLAFDEEAKLVYGVILSLRNMIRKLSGRWISWLICFEIDADVLVGMNSSSTIAPPPTSSISMRLCQATSSLCSATPIATPSALFCVRSTWAPS